MGICESTNQKLHYTKGADGICSKWNIFLFPKMYVSWTKESENTQPHQYLKLSNVFFFKKREKTLEKTTTMRHSHKMIMDPVQIPSCNVTSGQLERKRHLYPCARDISQSGHQEIVLHCSRNNLVFVSHLRSRNKQRKVTSRNYHNHCPRIWIQIRQFDQHLAVYQSDTISSYCEAEVEFN